MKNNKWLFNSIIYIIDSFSYITDFLLNSERIYKEFIVFILTAELNSNQ